MILYYHGVGDRQRGAFARQMDILMRWTTPVRADVLPPLPQGERYAAVTFDDAFISVWENAVPELESRGIPAAVFVPTAWLGKPPGWGKYGAATQISERVISPKELSTCRGNSLLTIGSHSATHKAINEMTDCSAFEELNDSKRILKELTGYDVSLFSFPYGELDARTVDLARKVGYQRVFTVVPTYALRSQDEYVCGRVSVSPDDWPVEFWLKLMGAYGWMPAASAVKGMLVSALRGRHRAAARNLQVASK